jgi:sulfate permease, SulP family
VPPASDSSLPAPTRPAPPGGFAAACSAAAVTVPHAVGLGLIAFAPLAAAPGGGLSLASLALWSAALPGAILTLACARAGVVYAPTTVVAPLFAAVVATVSSQAGALAMTPAQVLAACGATVALAFMFQWLFGVLRLATVARFLPISVTHGFAAGVGLSMAIGQVKSGFGAGSFAWDAGLALHAAAALGVVVLAVLLQWRWRRVPGLLPAVALVALAIALLGLSERFAPSIRGADFAWPPLPDWSGVPWLALARQQGSALVSLALLMALVNSLEILVFNQELELEHGLRGNTNQALRRESLLGALCALAGLIPASTSASRSRIVLQHAGGPARGASVWHAAILLGVAATGHLWLAWVPMACLAGGLLLAGFMQVPRLLWSVRYARSTPDTWGQSWLVAGVFAVAGGVGALIAGLVVATFVLLRASASKVLRHTHLDGQLRSRRLRRAVSDAWLAQRMDRVAVFELQGVMSFGVAAHMAEQVRLLVRPQHQRAILDASRVPAWDSTALAQLRALVRDLAQRGVVAVVAALDPAARALVGPRLHVFPDLDRALEWAEDRMLDERSASERPAYPERDLLGEIGERLGAPAREQLQTRLVPQALAAHELLFSAGDTDTDLVIVQSAHITLSTHWPPDTGLRLATVGQGMVFGEMAFLNGLPRTACAGAEAEPVDLMRLSRADFEAWAAEYPRDALVLVSNLALMGTRRLAATTRQLRAVLE